MAAHGLVMGFAAILLPQLRQPDSIIPIDDTSGSWIELARGHTKLSSIVAMLFRSEGRCCRCCSTLLHQNIPTAAELDNGA
ncbi:jg20659 [Pararge aegeria aegeria]|uniref:Jg20659 protein n=1 Tax=Pararge aegeria aegeria TaxID=348720 RepID=A0A8S4RDX1_9NEOP|nr:jg20659 [Pararge aegeria aegeria]